MKQELESMMRGLHADVLPVDGSIQQRINQHLGRMPGLNPSTAEQKLFFPRKAGKQVVHFPFDRGH
jgi:hypothetical protein